MDIRIMQVGMLGANCYIIGCPETKNCLVVDIGGDGNEVAGEIKKVNWTPKVIFCTHGHFDHIGGISDFRQHFPEAKIYIHSADAEMLVEEGKNLCYMCGYHISAPKADVLVKDGDVIEVGTLRFKVLGVPGHTRGGVALYLEKRGKEPGVVFCGDTVFKNSIGRSDFPGGNQEILVYGIRDKILSLPDDTVLYPGHMEPTTVGAEKKHNDFLKSAL